MLCRDRLYLSGRVSHYAVEVGTCTPCPSPTQTAILVAYKPYRFQSSISSTVVSCRLVLLMSRMSIHICRPWNIPSWHQGGACLTVASFSLALFRFMLASHEMPARACAEILRWLVRRGEGVLECRFERRFEARPSCPGHCSDRQMSSRSQARSSDSGQSPARLRDPIYGPCCDIVRYCERPHAQESQTQLVNPRVPAPDAH